MIESKSHPLAYHLRLMVSGISGPQAKRILIALGPFGKKIILEITFAVNKPNELFKLAKSPVSESSWIHKTS